MGAILTIDALTIPEQLPENFIKSAAFDERIEVAIKATSNLVYELDDSGEKQAKKDATAINKFTKALGVLVTEEYKSQTVEIDGWRDRKKQKLAVLSGNRQQLIDQFAESRTLRLELVRHKLNVELAYAWHDKGVRTEYQSETGEIDGLTKLSALTPKDVLTAKSSRCIADLAARNHEVQMRIDARITEIEISCLRAEINPPFSREFLGESLFLDADIFQSKLSELISLELSRRAEHEQRIKRKLEADKQAEIDAALRAQQAESDRIAQESAQKTQDELRENNAKLVKAIQAKSSKVSPEMPKVTPETPKVSQKTPAVSPKNHKVTSEASSGKHEVEITAHFKITVKDGVSNNAIHDHFVKSLPDDIKQALVSARVELCL